MNEQMIKKIIELAGCTVYTSLNNHNSADMAFEVWESADSHNLFIVTRPAIARPDFESDVYIDEDKFIEKIEEVLAEGNVSIWMDEENWEKWESLIDWEAVADSHNIELPVFKVGQRVMLNDEGKQSFMDEISDWNETHEEGDSIGEMKITAIDWDESNNVVYEVSGACDAITSVYESEIDSAN